jgi:selenide,water dikinase
LRNAGLFGDIEDAAVISIPGSELVLVKNLDVFTPIVDEPHTMGQIAACNVTNDIFAMNVPEISGMLVFLAIQTKTPQAVAEGILEGIKYFIEKKVSSKVVGGHTIYSEWPLIGGEASGFVRRDAIIAKSGVRKGDKIFLTKPIGLQAIMACYRLLKDFPEMLEQYSKPEIQKSIDFAIELMTTPNQPLIKVIHSLTDYSFIHAMSDCTGFGLAGHIKEMLQHSKLSAVIEKTPSIKLAKELSEELGYAFDDCTCHETAGGMILAVDPTKSENFSKILFEKGIAHWIVGEIDAKEPKNVRVSDHVENIEVLTL